MKIGFISDIHGNIQALDAVMGALEAERVEHILCAGDLVCYGANPNEVVRAVQCKNISCVTGNYDAAVGWDLPKASREPSSPRNEPFKQAALDWTKTIIEKDCQHFLSQLPWTSVFDIAGTRIQTVHAGFDYLDDWLSPSAPESLYEASKKVSANIVVLGHTHQIFTYTCNDVLFINPGPVGRSLDQDPRASFAMFDTDTLETSFHRIDYEIEEAMDAIIESGMPNEIAELIRHGARRIEEVGTV